MNRVRHSSTDHEEDKIHRVENLVNNQPESRILKYSAFFVALFLLVMIHLAWPLGESNSGSSSAQSTLALPQTEERETNEVLISSNQIATGPVSTTIHVSKLNERGATQEELTNPSCVPSIDHLLPRPNSKCIASLLIVGGRKCGTTSLYHYLSQHPDFFGVRIDGSPREGELPHTRYWDDLTLNSTQLAMRYNKTYEREFNAMGYSKKDIERIYQNDALTGDSTVETGARCLGAQSLVKGCGNGVKVIYLVRDPVEKLESLYNMRMRLGTTLGPNEDPDTKLETYFWSQMEMLENKLKNKGPEFLLNRAPENVPCLYKRDFKNPVWSGMYAVHLQRWTGYPRGNILVLKSEDMFRDPAKVLTQVFRFAGLDPQLVDVNKITAKVYNGAPKDSNKSQGKFSSEVRKYLKEFYRPYNEHLAREWCVDISSWQT